VRGCDELARDFVEFLNYYQFNKSSFHSIHSRCAGYPLREVALKVFGCLDLGLQEKITAVAVEIFCAIELFCLFTNYTGE